jgi:hypothetical protein
MLSIALVLILCPIWFIVVDLVGTGNIKVKVQ